MLWCLRHGRDPDELMRRLRRWFGVIDEQIERWAERVLTASTLEEVIGTS